MPSNPNPSIPAPAAIDINNVRKTFYHGSWNKNKILALRGVSLKVNQGEFFGILGPNGAGKTTLINILSMLLEPDSGDISILGHNLQKSKHDIRLMINTSSGHANFPWCLTIEENLRFYGMLYGLWGRPLKQRVRDCLELMELGPIKNRQFQELSTGNKQRLSLAKALINKPKILLLDEPSVGLDPDISIKLREAIKNIHQNEGVTIILTTHYMDEAENLCQRIAFLKQGRIKALGSPDELKKKASTPNLEKAFLAMAADQINDSAD